MKMIRIGIKLSVVVLAVVLGSCSTAKVTFNVTRPAELVVKEVQID